jgi:hemerythrin-like domain-containing protein
MGIVNKQHNHFRQTWQMLYNACLNNKRPANLSLKQFISTGLQFCSHLSTHHAIEEQHIFPLLAQKMPEFKAGRNAAELLRQHKEIHKGMDAFEEYLEGCRSGEHELSLVQMKVKMDSWGTVLWSHLEQEVKTLGAENMRKYWTIEEMRRMPM